MLVLAGVCGLGKPANALGIPTARLLNTQVPANGVLRFTVREGVTVRILAADGSEVPGQFVADGVWRPDEPFTVDTYTADLSWEEHPTWVKDATFEVTPAIDPSSLLASVTIESRVDADPASVLEQVCCLAGVTQPAEPCDGACPPLCVPTVWAAKQTVSVYVQPASAVLDYQLEVRELATTGAGEFTLGYWDVDGAPEDLCGVAEVFSWLDESATTIRTCISNPKPALTPIEEPVLGFNLTPECTIPPVGYEALWCKERHNTCEEPLSTFEGDQLAYVISLCEHYGEVCQGSGAVDAPGVVSTEAPQSGAGAGGEVTSSDDSPDDLTAHQSDDGAPMLRSVESPRGGCAMVAAPRTRLGAQSLLAVMGLAVALASWRLRRGAR